MRKLLVCLALAFAAPAQAQSFGQLAPALGLPGDTLAVHGSGFDTVSAIRFHATVGGALGVLTVDAPVTILSSELLLVDVPLIGAFAPPGAVAPSDPIGFLELISPLTPGQLISFQYLEASFGAYATYGDGGAELGAHEPRIGWRLQFGPPVAGNANFDARVYAMPPGASCFLAVGVPATAPFAPFAGGELLLDPNAPLLVVPGGIPASGPAGESLAKLPLPASAAGLTLGLQWVGVDPQSLTLAVSNALSAQL